MAQAEGGEIVGWIHIFVRRGPVHEPYAEIGGMVVDGAQRGKGIGRGLLDEAESWAALRGCKAVRVRSNVVRDAAHGFYPSAGYETIKTQHVYRKLL